MIRIKLAVIAAVIAIIVAYSTMPLHANLQYHGERLNFTGVNAGREIKVAFAEGRRLVTTYHSGMPLGPEKNLIQY
ncbi:MAG: hypothetical protein NT036_04630 [Candidatus Omnitrophica bacterium]|nr:hypothetical protein [Candidatus Omnitrophota bacterium]